MIIPHGRIPKKVPTNHVYIHVNNNNFITKKRFQVAPIKEVFHGALIEQQGTLLLCMLNGAHMHLYKHCSYSLFHHVN